MAQSNHDIANQLMDTLEATWQKAEARTLSLSRELAQVRVLLRQSEARAKASDRDYAALEEAVERVHGLDSVMCAEPDCEEWRGDNPADLCPGHAGDFDCAGDEVMGMYDTIGEFKGA